MYDDQYCNGRMRTFIFSGVILIFIIVQLLRGGAAINTIDGDGSGYYAYLTAVFVNGSTDFTKVYEVEKSKRGLDYMGHYFHPLGEKMINKYYLGTALMMLPFFLLAWIYSTILGIPPDGYNILFQYAISLGAAFYAALGLIALKRFIESFEIEKKVSLITVAVILLGTNLFFYTFLHPSHSHVYSFAVITLFLTFSRHFFLFSKKIDFYLAAFFFGLIMLIRPTNGIVIFALPFVSGSFSNLRVRSNWLLSKPRTLIFGMILFLVIFGLQPLFNYYQTGHLMFWSYRNEGFHFDKPAFLSFLFSYRKGFFIYTPLMTLIVPAFVLLYQRSRYFFYSFFIYFIFVVYFLSSWWNWFYGDSFGMRAMIDHYSILSIPLALLIHQFSKHSFRKIALTLFLSAVVSLNMIQVYQYYIGIIHHDSMTKEKYWYVFLKTDTSYSGILGSFPEPVYAKINEKKALNYYNDMESPSKLWTSNGIQVSDQAYSGRFVAEMSQSNIYSPTLNLTSDQLFETATELYITANFMYKEFDKNAIGDALLVYAATDKNNNLSFYKTFKIKQIPDYQIYKWRNATFGFKVPAWKDSLRQVKVYVWNRQTTLFHLDDFEVNIHEIATE